MSRYDPSALPSPGAYAVQTALHTDPPTHTPLHSEIHTRHPQCSNHVKAAVQHASDPFLQRELLHPFQRVQVKRRILPDAEKELVVKLLQNMLKTS